MQKWILWMVCVIHGFVNMSCDQAWTMCRSIWKRVCNLAWLNTYARRSRGRQKTNTIYSDLAICLSSPRIRDEKSTCLFAPNRAINMQAIRTNPSLSRHKIQTSENIDTRLDNGRTTSNVILVLSSCAMLSSCKTREKKPTGLLAPDPFLTCERAWKAMENYFALS
jgi:hypothetical protein